VFKAAWSGLARCSRLSTGIVSCYTIKSSTNGTGMRPLIRVNRNAAGDAPSFSTSYLVRAFWRVVSSMI